MMDGRRIAPKGFQIANIKRWLVDQGIPWDVLDLEAEVDGTLPLNTNWAHIKGKLESLGVWREEPSSFEVSREEGLFRKAEREAMKAAVREEVSGAVAEEISGIEREVRVMVERVVKAAVERIPREVALPDISEELKKIRDMGEVLARIEGKLSATDRDLRDQIDTLRLVVNEGMARAEGAMRLARRAEKQAKARGVGVGVGIPSPQVMPEKPTRIVVRTCMKCGEDFSVDPDLENILLEMVVRYCPEITSQEKYFIPKYCPTCRKTEFGGTLIELLAGAAKKGLVDFKELEYRGLSFERFISLCSAAGIHIVPEEVMA